jgi:hypothetical protein
VGRLTAPLSLGGGELLPTLVKLGSCLGVSGVRRRASATTRHPKPHAPGN